MKLKDTLQLGHTNFEMRANLPSKEVVLQKEWEEADLYHQIQTKNEGRPSYILHDGPPYANGKLHMGHALNKITKDFIVRYKSMSGFRAPYIPGWDTHGLPIESALTNSKKIDRKQYSVADFRRLCEEYALQQVESQKLDFKRLGVTGDWDHPYLTLKPEYEAEQLRVFGKMAEKGYIYKGLKPIYWSPSSESSLAEAEVEYYDVTSPSIYVAFPLKDGKGQVSKNAELIIWTTTPWTLPANLGISVNPEAIYVEVQVGPRLFIVAKELLETVASELSWENYTIQKELLGANLDHLVAKHPFYDRDSLVMVGDHVTLDAGTGLVHTAPGHGEDDYQMGIKYQLDILSPIDNRGHFTNQAEGLEGIFYLKGNNIVIDWLRENGRLLAQKNITHSYPHDWRTKKPIIYRATPQWFASIDKFRNELLTAVENDVEWFHPSGKVRIYNMLRDRGDWVISRQRVWGVPLPIFYAEDGQAILDNGVIEHVASLVEKEGSNIWFERDAKALLPEGYSHPGSPNGLFTKETDIMDVWFDSGTSYASVLKREGQAFPADLYLEGSDQYRGWFNSSLTTSVAVNGQPPYKAVLSQGFVMDGKGQKMSKSLGNTIIPEDVMKELGADIIRLWVASVDYENDVRISNEILKQISETYRKIRNTIRFMLSHLNDFHPDRDAVTEFRPVDQYILAKLNILIHDMNEAYEKFDYSTIYKKVINFITVDLSSFYLDFAKDVLYIESVNAYPRRVMQTVIYQVLHALIPLLTPILLHTMEEAWRELPGVEGYVQLTDVTKVDSIEEDLKVVEKWQTFFEVKDNVNKVLEDAKNAAVEPVKKAFEAHVTVYGAESLQAELNNLSDNLAQLFIVSQFTWAPIETVDTKAVMFEGMAVKVERAQGDVCDRCRAVRTDCREMHDGSQICSRCHAILAADYPEYLNPIV